MKSTTIIWSAIMLNIIRKVILTTSLAVFAAPANAMFIQPDLMTPGSPGVGTNQYAYSGSDPINKSDPSGYAWVDRTWDSAFGSGSFDRTFGNGASESMDRVADSVFGNSSDRATASAYGGYRNSGGNLGYDDWRFSSGNLTASYINDAYQSAVPAASRSHTNRLRFGAALIDLAQHEGAGGHTIRRHVNLSDAQLRSWVSRQTLIGPIGFGRRTHGSFTSVAAAQRLVSSTIASRPDLVAGVSSGILGDAVIDKAFGSVTGREAFRVSKRINSPVIIRPTRNVRTVIQPHGSLPGGFILRTSFPHNNQLMPF